jgi:hypothetical protein
LIFGGISSPANSPSLRSAQGSFSVMKQVMPLYGGSAFGSVFISTNTTPEPSPLVTHIFWPLSSQAPSSFCFAVDLIPCTSDPTSGSDSEKAARISPVAIFGRK